MIRATALAIALTAATVGAETLTLTPAQMRVVASESVLKGLPAQAVALSEALLSRDPHDVDALLILSRATRDLGDNSRALEAARKAWQLAERDEHRFAAAMARAQALSSDGKRTRAQLWLRRAAHVAPNDHASALAKRDFRYVRSRNPWQTHLKFNLSPSDNVNNGSTSETTQLFGLPLEFQLNGTSRALPGTEVALGFETRYRLIEGELGHLDATFGLTHRTYILSAEAKRRAPGVEGRDFALTQADIGLKTAGTFAEGSRFGYSAAIEAGRAWYAGDPYLDVLRTHAALSYTPGPRTQLQASYGHEWQMGIGARDDAGVDRARLSVGHLLPGNTRLDLSLGWERSVSDATYLDYTRRDVSARLTLGKPVLGTQVSFGLSAAEKVHDFSSLTGGVREETTLGADLSLTFTEMEVMGFVPSVRLHSSRTDGTIDLLDKTETGLGFGIQSSF